MNSFKLLPRYEEYIVYITNIISKSPKICRLSIGDQFQKAMYKTMYNIYRLIYKRNGRLDICNEIDALFAYQRSLIRVMYENRYIDSKKKMTSIKILGELGKILGGYVKSIGVANGKES